VSLENSTKKSVGEVTTIEVDSSARTPIGRPPQSNTNATTNGKRQRITYQ
jgi:hypothetical protein